MEKQTLDSLLKKTKESDLCRYYKLYDQDIQIMVENLYTALYRIGLFNSQIIYVLNKALEPFEHIKAKKQTKTPQFFTKDIDSINNLFNLQ